MASALFMQILGFLSRCYGLSRNPDVRALLRIGEAIAHLEANYDKPVNLNELASIAHMSKRSFMRTFYAATGNSPISYLIKLRVNHAAGFLRHSSDSITDIAFRVGFGDSNYFTRQFRNIIGVSPRAYRQQHNIIG